MNGPFDFSLVRVWLFLFINKTQLSKLSNGHHDTTRTYIVFRRNPKIKNVICEVDGVVEIRNCFALLLAPPRLTQPTYREFLLTAR